MSNQTQHAPLIDLPPDVDVQQVADLNLVLGYNVGELDKCLLWALKYHRAGRPDLVRGYLLHLVTNLSDVLVDVEKLAKAVGVPWNDLVRLSDAREVERRETFEATGRPYI
jgi:hypothetical protein